jgi:hypothetical protein
MTKGRWFKLLCVAVYATIVAGITAYVHLRVEPHTQAAHQIGKNQLIVDADLRSIDQKEISGRYATRLIEAGEPITPDDVSRTQLPLPPNAVAAVISMARPRIGSILGPDTTLQVCLDQKPFGKPAKALTFACDKSGCVVTIPLEAWPKDDSFATVPRRLSAVITGEPCGSEAASAPAGHGTER